MRSHTITLSVEEARAFCRDVYRQLDVPDDELEILTDYLIDASLRGIDTHGILLNHIYAERIRSGQIVPGRRLKVVRETPTTALVDACQGIGQVSGVEAMNLAVRKAHDHGGLGAVTVFNASHNGAISYYALLAARERMIGIVLGNSTPRVAPYGGRAGLHGTNPVAYAVPAGSRHPIVLDFATATSGAAIRQAVEDGLTRIPEGLALDREGNPTTDPQAAFDGWLLPKAGPVGYGLGLLADVLIGALSGSNCGKDVPPVTNIDAPYGCGSFMLAIDPGAFIRLERYTERVEFLIDSARAIPPAEGFDRVRLPGERGFEEKARRLKEGIPVRRVSWERMMDALERCGLDVARWRR